MLFVNIIQIQARRKYQYQISAKVSLRTSEQKSKSVNNKRHLKYFDF